MSHTVRRTTGSLPDATAGSVRALARAAADIDGVPPLSEQPLLWLTGGGPAVHHLLVGPDEAPTGYAQLDLRDPARATAELVVHPEHRRTGRGTALLDALTTTAEQVDVWAHGDLPAARSLAARRGLPVVRELWQMRLDPLTTPAAPMPTPPDVLVRPFVPGRDEGPWLALNAAAFAHHPEQGRLDRADLTARQNEPWFDPAGFLLAESRADGRLLAAGWTKVPPGEDEGEIYVLGVHPGAQGRGLGRLLTDRMLSHLADRGLRAVVLYTEGDNTPAVRTYQRAGFVRSAVDVVFRL
ncbi:mycothiol synthase [Cellulomonas taurus]|uniref:mycothiol synthase n=1 Tax=Cellulomonas taurus TaxID=2729175 RepID=UPI00145C8B2E|nr:mycothiol synthase [Cellulomonas taurus]